MVPSLSEVQWSSDPVDDLLSAPFLYGMAIPTAKHISILHTSWSTTSPEGRQSLLIYRGPDPNDAIRVPPWIISHWKYIVAINQRLEHWKAAERWLRSPAVTKSLRTRTLAEQVTASFESLPWSGPLRGFHRGGGDVDSLSVYLSDAWLANEHIDQTLDTLAFCLDNPDAILSTAFWDAIAGLYKRKESLDGAPWISAIGREFTTGQRTQLGSIALVGAVPTTYLTNPNHWVAYLLDYSESTIYYADSYGPGAPPPSKFRKVLDTFIDVFPPPSGTRPFQFKEKSLDINHQSDSSSCGFFATDALIHHFLQSPPIQQSHVLERRLESFLEVCRHYHRGPAVCSSSAIPIALCSSKTSSFQLTTRRLLHS